MDESIRDALISYSPPEEIGDPNFEVMFEDDPKFLGIHVIDALIEICDDDQFVRSRIEKKAGRRRLRKVMNKLERMK